MVLLIIALIVTALMAAGIILIGVRFLVAPTAATKGFGVSSVATDPYLSVKGVRDIATGVIALVLLLVGNVGALGWFVIAASLIPIGDTIIVLRAQGRRSIAFGTHGATAALMIATGICLILS